MESRDHSDYTLVVGQDGDERRRTEERLRQMGLPVSAASVEEILARPSVPPPRLVVLAAAAGRDARRRMQAQLRRHPRLRHLGLLVLGEESDMLSLSLAIGSGASAYLAKRVSDDVLACVIEKLQRPPSEPRAVEQRRHPRRPFLVPIEVDAGDAAGRATAWLMDASASGCCIETAAGLKQGDAVRLWLPLAEATAHQPLTGQARWVRSESAGRALAGICFGAAATFMAGLALGIDAD